MKPRILIIDDEESILESLSRVLRKKYDVATAISGYDGLALFAGDARFAVVIVDQKMPGMDGIEFLTHVRKVSPSTVRIMLSGNRDFDASIRAVNEGNVFRFLTKPFPANLLQEVLDTAVEQYDMNLELNDTARMREQAQNTLSVCSYCKKVREPDKPPQEKSSWERIEMFLSRHFGFRFTHSVCPDCVDKLYSELEDLKRRADNPIIVDSDASRE